MKIVTSLRSLVLIGGACALLTSAGTASAQVRPDFPGAKQSESGPGAAPRSDFPGAKQNEPAARPDFPGAKQGDTGGAPRTDFPGAKQGDGTSK